VARLRRLLVLVSQRSLLLVLLLVLDAQRLVRLLTSIVVTGSLAVSAFFLNNKLLSGVSIDLGSSYQLVSLLDLLLLVLLQTFLTLVGSEFTVRCALRKVVGVLAGASSAGRVLSSLRSISTSVGWVLLVSFK
jgi:hypothetical protein